MYCISGTSLCVICTVSLVLHCVLYVLYLWYFTVCCMCVCTTGRRRHAKDMIVNLSYERERLSQLVKEEEEEMKKLSDILRIVEV